MRALPLTLLALALAGCTSASTSSGSMTGGMPTSSTSQAMGAGMAEISLVDFAFQPAQATAAMADGVHFTSHGQATHTVTITDASGAQVMDTTLKPGDSAHFTPPAAGAYHVHCRFHSTMTADLTIQ